MRLLWAYEHDFAAISPFLYERIGTLCRHPCWSLWLEQRIAGWRSGRSEGYCKSLSSGHAPTDLLLLTQRTVRFPGDFAGLSHGAPSISFGAPSVDRMSIAASGDGFTSSEDEGAVGLPPSGVVATAAPDPELTAMLARAAVSIGLEVNRPPSPEPSRLDDWFLGAGRGSQPRPAPVPFFPEVHEELTSSWMAPFTARSRSSASSVLTTLDGWVARGYAGIPQVERAVAVHLCPRNAATWRNHPRLPSKACKLTAVLAAKAYSAGSRRSGPDVGNPEMLEFVLSQETARTAPLLPPVEGREENLLFRFVSVYRLRYPPSQRKSNFLFLRVLRSMGRQCAMPCLLTLAHDPFCQ